MYRLVIYMNMAMEQESYEVDTELCKMISFLQGLLGSNYRGSMPVSFNYDAFSTVNFVHYDRFLC